MLYSFCLFKTTVPLLLLASCLGQELLRTCDRDYCYERSVERHNIKEDHLREWHHSERLSDDTERKNKIHQEHTDNRRDFIEGVRANRLEISDFESRRLNSRRESVEIPRELDNLTSREESLRIHNEQRAKIDGNNAQSDEIRRSVSSRRDLLTVDKNDNYQAVDRRFDETHKTERLSQRTFRETQNPVENEREERSVTSKLLNQRKNHQVENRESLHFYDRLSETKHVLEQRRQREMNKINRESRRLIERMTDENTKQLQGTFEERTDNEERNNRGSEVENQRSNRNDFRLHNKRVSENKRHLELSERDESRRLSLRELNTLDKYERRFNERERLTENGRLIENFAEEDNRQEGNNRLRKNHEFRRSMDRVFNEERLPEKRESLRRLSEYENERSSERLFQTDLEKETITIRAENQRDSTNDIRLSNKRVSENERRFELLDRDESRRLPLRELNVVDKYESRLNERERLTENRRLIERISKERNRQERERALERNHESRRSNDRFSETEGLPKTFFENESHHVISRRDNRDRQSQNLNEQIDKHFQRIQQLQNDNEQKRENNDRQETLKQLAHGDNRYDISRRLNEIEHENILRQSGDTREYSDNRVRISESYFGTKQRELKDRREVLKIIKHVDQRDISRGLNNRFEHQYEYLRERENVLNRNAESQRLNSRLVEFEKDTLQNRDKIQRNIRERLGKNPESQRILLNKEVELQLKSVERRNEDVNELDERREELRQIQKREGKRDNNRAFNEKHVLRRFDESNFENNENVQRRIENRDARIHNNRRDENESTRNNVSNMRHDDKLLQRSDENKRERNERQNRNLNYRDFHYKVYEYKEKPTLSFNKNYVAFGQTALLAYIVIKTLNGKDNIKYNIYQKLQEAIALMGF